MKIYSTVFLCIIDILTRVPLIESGIKNTDLLSFESEKGTQVNSILQPAGKKNIDQRKNKTKNYRHGGGELKMRKEMQTLLCVNVKLYLKMNIFFNLPNGKKNSLLHQTISRLFPSFFPFHLYNR